MLWMIAMAAALLVHDGPWYGPAAVFVLWVPPMTHALLRAIAADG